MKLLKTMFAAVAVLALAGCLSEAPEGIHPAQPANTTVKMDFDHRPLPDIPLPNDIATRLDETSPTGRRINASMVAPTTFESHIRTILDKQDGWGVVQPVTIPFTGPLDVQSILDGHRDSDYDTSNDVIYLIDIDRDSPEFGKLHHLDLGNGNYPPLLERYDKYWKNDPRGWLNTLLFEEEYEDKNNNGVLDPGEDTDGDGVLDRPNYLPGHSPAKDDYQARADALMTFYERETNTIIAIPLVPLRSRTTYAVVVTRRLLDANGQPVGSPYPYVNHNAQTEALTPLSEVLPDGIGMDDIAFAYSFTTQSIETDWIAVRDGLYGHGVQGHIADEVSTDVGLLPARDPDRFPDMTNPHIMYTENFKPAFQAIALGLLGSEPGSVAITQLLESQDYIDYHVIGYFDSPQLFNREDADGNPLRFDDQRWPEDLDRVPAAVRPERVYFHLVMPRKEISDRGAGEPAPVVLYAHGYGSSRFEMASFAGFFAKFGVATLSIDAVSHGIDIGPDEYALAETIFNSFGITPFAEAVFMDRATDQNNDGRKDSGADFWINYVFHTRDNVRQTALDYLQLAKIVKSFDGTRKWDMDVDGDGENDLAGDFDGDGNIDIGGDANMFIAGGSLGGIMSNYVASIEPHVDATVAIVAGGNLSTLGTRSLQGGIPEAFILRVMGPLYMGTLGTETTNEDGEPVWQDDPTGSQFRIETCIPNLTRTHYMTLAVIDDVQVGDTFYVENEVNGERHCGWVDEQGRVRAAVASDIGDATRIEMYRGDVLIPGEQCRIRSGSSPYRVVDTYEREVEFQAEILTAGTPLYPLAEGLGLKRGTPAFRRLVNLAQLVMDKGDPVAFSKHLFKEPLTYPGTGETTGAHALMMPSVGDMGVPVHGGIALGRAAGIVEYLEPHPDYGKPENQVLLDTYMAEAVDITNRYRHRKTGIGVHIDTTNMSEGRDIWKDDIPRLEPPMRPGLDHEDDLGGTSAFLLAYGDERGSHGFPLPGEMTDSAIEQCEDNCPPDVDCDCRNTVDIWDVGNFFVNMGGFFAYDKGKRIRTDRCLAENNCEEIPPPPPLRDNPDLNDVAEPQ